MDIVYRFDPYAPIQLNRPKSNGEALDTLSEGNGRFVAKIKHLQEIQDSKNPDPIVFPIDLVQLGVPLVDGMEQMHSPYAAIVGCADARVPVEHIFDCLSNDVFVVRVAGNVLGLECIGSIDYAATALKESIQCVIVLGHTGCGAVSAAVDIYLAPSSFAEIAFSHPVRTLIDRIMVSVRSAAAALEEVHGSHVNKKEHYRNWLINSSCFLNAAITAYDLQREVHSVSENLAVSYTVYDMSYSTIHPTPIQNKHQKLDKATAFARAPKSPDELHSIARAIAKAIPISYH